MQDQYPFVPGSRRKDGAGAAAAKRYRGKRDSAMALTYQFLRDVGDAAPEEMATILNRRYHNVYSRCSDLKALGLVKETNQTVTNKSTGYEGTIVTITDREEVIAFIAKREAMQKGEGAVIVEKIRVLLDKVDSLPPRTE